MEMAILTQERFERRIPLLRLKLGLGRKIFEHNSGDDGQYWGSS
jgi:hypothetical protein